MMNEPSRSAASILLRRKKGRFFCLIALYAMSNVLLPVTHSFATCKENKPKNWATGDVIQAPASSTTPIVVCANASINVGVSASDSDRWAIRCKADDSLQDSGYSGDSLKYQWSGSGSFANSTSASTSWTAPATTGNVTLTCTIDDVPTALGTGETGSRDDAAITRTVTVCVIDPGTAPSGVGTVTYNEHVVTAPASDTTNWGLTSPSGPTVDSQAALDCATKKWKAVVTTATSDYNIFYRRLPPAAEADLSAATEDNYCDMIANLNSLFGPDWYMTSAVEAHERVHVASWKSVVDKNFATAKAAIEALSVAATCSKTSAGALAELKGLAGYSKAINDMDANITTEWTASIATDHAGGGPTDTVEHGIVDARIQEIRDEAARNHWKACP